MLRVAYKLDRDTTSCLYCALVKDVDELPPTLRYLFTGNRVTAVVNDAVRCQKRSRDCMVEFVIIITFV